MSDEVMGSAMLSGASEDATGVAVIELSEWGAVRELRARGKSKKAIARELGLSIKTVRKWLREEWEPQKRPARGSSRMAGFEEFLEGRAPEVGFNGAVLLREIEVQGYKGSYPTLQRYLRPLRAGWHGGPEATMRFETAPGRQGQVDWGELKVWIGGVRTKVHIFTMILGYSRRIFARGYASEGIGCLLDGHEKAFAHFGGRTEVLLYDNPRTIVKEKNEATGHVVWNPTFKDRIDFYGIEPKLCRYYRAQTKGKVESGVKYVKRNALAGRQFETLEQLNAWLEEWSVRVADERIHGTTHERPRERFERDERAALVSVEARPPSVLERITTRRVPKDAYVSMETNRYPVPYEWVGREVVVRSTGQEVILHCGEEPPIRHPRVEGKYKLAPWSAAPRKLPREAGCHDPESPPRFDPNYLSSIGQVDARPLSIYEQLAEVRS